MADEAFKVDARGLHLCPNCWNGMHFSTQMRRRLCASCRDDHKHHRPYRDKCRLCRWVPSEVKISECYRGQCECPCTMLQADLEAQQQGRKLRREQNRKAQLNFFR